MAWNRRGRRGRGGMRAGPWPGRGPFSYLPPWQRPGWLFGGYGLGGGPGFRWQSYSYGPWTCRRFPWLPRWWWMNPMYTMGYGPRYGYPRMMHPLTQAAPFPLQAYGYPYTPHPPHPTYKYPYIGYW